MRGPGLHRARRSACSGWAAATLGWLLLTENTHGQDQAWALAITFMCAGIAGLYALLLLIGGRR